MEGEGAEYRLPQCSDLGSQPPEPLGRSLLEVPALGLAGGWSMTVLSLLAIRSTPPKNTLMPRGAEGLH